MSCSALKRAYRDAILGRRAGVRLVYLKGEKELIAERMAARLDHFMPPALLDSQFATLEEPAADERALVVPVSPQPRRGGGVHPEGARARGRPLRLIVRGGRGIDRRPEKPEIGAKETPTSAGGSP